MFGVPALPPVWTWAPKTPWNHDTDVGRTVAKRALNAVDDSTPSGAEIAPDVTPPGCSTNTGALKKLVFSAACALATTGVARSETAAANFTKRRIEVPPGSGGDSGRNHVLRTSAGVARTRWSAP